MQRTLLGNGVFVHYKCLEIQDCMFYAGQPLATRISVINLTLFSVLVTHAK